MGQDPIDVDLVLVEERDHLIIEAVGRGQWVSCVCRVGKAGLGDARPSSQRLLQGGRCPPLA